MEKTQEILRELVAIPSISSADAKWDLSNRPIIDHLAARFERLGFAVEIQELDNNKANLIASIGHGSGGLVLSGHTDTVPYDGDLWTSDPFVLHDAGDRFLGLGSTDMKGFFAVTLEALERLDKSKLQTLSKPLTIVATADEESSMSGARALSDADPLNARFAIIGEPTGLQPVRMHKGIMMESISLKGQSGHSSNPALGHSALEAMHLVISQLIELRQSWTHQFNNPGFEVSVPTMNLASIHGGDSPNRICQHCKLGFDVRLLPGMSNDDIRQQIKQVVSNTLQGSGVSAEFSTLFTGVEPFLESSDSELVKTVENLTGHQAVSAGYATEAPFMQALGMQTVVMGPGSIDCAHQANEFFPKDQIETSISLIIQLVNHYCMA